jgi:hypothetical protein
MVHNLQKSLLKTVNLRLDMDNDRRRKSRYPLQLNVRYQTMGTAVRVTAAGQTVNLSSGGVLISSSSPVREGTRVKAVFEWPSLLNGNIPLQLVTVGTVVRRQGSRLAIAFEGYQFRTAGRATVATMPEPRTSAGYQSPELPNLRIVAKSSQ